MQVAKIKLTKYALSSKFRLLLQKWRLGIYFNRFMKVRHKDFPNVYPAACGFHVSRQLFLRCTYCCCCGCTKLNKHLAPLSLPLETILSLKHSERSLISLRNKMKLTLATAFCVLTINSVNAFAPSTQVGSTFVGSVQLQSRNVAGE